jgi:hypothetical protein
MTKVGGPGVPPPVIPPADAKTAQATKDAKGTQPQQAAGKDQFVTNKAGQTPLQRLNFSSAELGNIAQGFAALLRRNPNASRKERARLFAAQVLKHKKLGAKLSAKLDASTFEEMLDALSEQLESAPGLSQWLDNLSDAARPTDG